MTDQVQNLLQFFANSGKGLPLCGSNFHSSSAFGPYKSEQGNNLGLLQGFVWYPSAVTKALYQAAIRWLETLLRYRAPWA